MKKWLIICITLVLTLTFCIFYTRSLPLYVFMWGGYIAPELIEAFEHKYHCQVLCDTFDSNESMFAKLQLGGAGYDILFPSNYYISLLAKHKLIEPLSAESLPNSSYVDTNLLKRVHAQETTYGIPYLLSFSGIAYRSDRVKEIPVSWNVFANSKYKGRMTLLNDIRETIGAALLSKGYKGSSTSLSNIGDAKKVLLTWKKNIAKFESEQHKNGIAGGEFLIVHGYASDCYQIAKDHPEVHFIYPKEGSLVSIDYIALSSHAQNKKLALAFINFLLEPKNMAKTMLYTGARAPNNAVRSYLPENERNNPLFFPEEDLHAHFESLEPIGDAQRIYSKVWNEIKGTENK